MVSATAKLSETYGVDTYCDFLQDGFWRSVQVTAVGSVFCFLEPVVFEATFDAGIVLPPNASAANRRLTCK